MTNQMQAHRQWANRLHDQRFLSLIELAGFVRQQQGRSRSSVVSSFAVRRSSAQHF